jgi:Domain of unknown function (DUF4336)
MSKLYLPIHVLKPCGKNIWLVDGPTVSFYGMPFTTRMVVVKMQNSELLIHSPINLTENLKQQLDNLGTVKYLISPNKIHYWYIDNFQKSYPQAITFASNGVQERSIKAGKNIVWNKELKDMATDYFADLEIIPMHGNRFMTEYTFFHKPSRTWIVTDIIENFESNKINPFFRLIAFLGGALSPKGGTTKDQQMLYFGNHEMLKKNIEKIKILKPAQIIMAHGKILEEKIEDELERIFGWV